MGVSEQGQAGQGGERRSLFRAGIVAYDEARQALTVDGAPRPLEAKPLALLHALLLRAGTLATKRALIEAVWGSADAVSEASLTVAMSKLRSALGDKGRDLIQVVPGAGYRIGALVEISAASTAPLAFALRAGDSVPGRPQWRLDRLLGAAPLNDVWLACHVKTEEKRVFKFADSQARLETLRREAALSRVLHTSLGPRDDLVRILEWNFEQRPYYIESAYGGQDLHGWIGAQGGLAAFAPAQRLAMLAQICRTIAAAHGAGVLHGDIKPANVLAAGEADAPVLRLADFGAGGLSDPARLAALAISGPGMPDDSTRGSGTLLYMAPELLAGGAPTTGADIYALGVLLYQFVSGDLQKPLSVGWEAGIADELVREDIAAAAAGDPARRLASATILAELLATLPARHAALRQRRAEAARAAGLAAQVQRSRQRRPWMIGAAASLAGGLALSTLFGIQTLHERDEARRRAELARSVNAFLTEDLLGRGNPAQSGKADETLMEAATAAEAGIDRRLGGAPLVAGSIYLSLAQAFDSRSANDAARAAYRNAIAAFRRAGDEGAATIAQLHEAGMDMVSGQAGAMQQAGAILADAARRVPGLTDRRAEAEVWLASGRAMMAMLGGDALAAQAGFKDAADRADAMPDMFDESTRLRLRLREAFTHVRRGDWAEAEKLLQVLVQRRLTLNGPHHPDTLQAELTLLQVRIAQGRAAWALPELNRIWPDFAAVFGPDHHLSLTFLGTRAQAYLQLERYGDALADQMTIYRRAVATTGDHSYFALGTLADASESQCRAGDTAAGLATARTAYEGGRRAFGPGHVLTQIAGADMAFCLIAGGHAAEAAALLAPIDAKAVAEATLDPDYGAELALMRAAIAFASGDAVQGRALLAVAAPALRRPGADVYMASWAQRLQKSELAAR